jgi:aminoglycoside 6'-N-acetyltransferase
MNITFKILDNIDLKILHQWLQHLHVRQFWDDGDRTIAQVANHYCKTGQVQRFIFFFDQQAAGYIQFYPIDQQHEYKKFSEAEQDVIGIDFFIGEPQFLNKNLAMQVLSLFIALHGQNASRILVDPEISNHKAIHIYDKYGFKKIATLAIKHKQHQLMAIHIRRTARAIISNSKEEILLIQIHTQPLQAGLDNKPSSFWVTVGGKIEKNESTESALIRELREEVGIITPPPCPLQLK